MFGIHHLPGVAIENAILEQREVQRPDDAAVALALRRQLAHHQTAVLNRQDARHLDDAGLDVDGDLGELHAAGRDGRHAGYPVAVGRDRLRANQLAGVGPRHSLRRIVLDLNAAARGDERCGIHAKRRRDLLLQRIERLDRRDADAGTDARRRRAAARPAAHAVSGVADLRPDL